MRFLFACFGRHLALKLTAVIVLFFATVAVAFGWYAIVSEKHNLREHINAQGQSLTKALSVTCVELFLLEDYPALDTCARLLVENKDNVACVWITRDDGQVVSEFPKGASANNQIIQQCQLYSAEIKPSLNSPDVLGTVHVGISTLRSDAMVYSRSLILIIGGGVSFAALAVVLLFTLNRVVIKPLGDIEHKALSLGEGDLSTPISIDRADEFGRLAAALDQMRHNLGSSYNEIHVQNEELKRTEKELQERTVDLQLTNSALKESNLAAEKANVAKSQFLANMSHEIRTPMTAILGFTDVILESAEDPQHVEAAKIVKLQGEHLLQLINDILDLSRIEAGKLELEEIAVSPYRIVTEVVSLMKARTNKKGLSLKVDFAGPVPETVMTDPTRLRQILINLVGNAIKFTETGEIRIVTSLVENAGAGPKLQIQVIDTGIGMTEQEITKAFGMFNQADASTTRKYGGSGLGLAISKRLAEKLGGRITVRSRPKEGSNFTLTVAAGPLDNVRLLENSTQTELSQDPVELNERTLDCRLLLIEDGPENQQLVSLLLQKAGAEVVVAENGQIGVDQALAARDEGEPFDIILMDMQLPIMNGYDATRRLRSEGYKGPIVALTAYAMQMDRQKCLNAGCDDYMTKPIDREQLLAMVVEYTLKDHKHTEAAVKNDT